MLGDCGYQAGVDDEASQSQCTSSRSCYIKTSTSLFCNQVPNVSRHRRNQYCQMGNEEISYGFFTISLFLSKLSFEPNQSKENVVFS